MILTYLKSESATTTIIAMFASFHPRPLSSLYVYLFKRFKIAAIMSFVFTGAFWTFFIGCILSFYAILRC